MGCGSSKTVAVAGTNAPKKVVVAAAAETEIQQKEPITSTPRNSKNVAKKGKSSPGDSGVEEGGVITENTANGHEIAGKNRPTTPELVVSGARPPARSTHAPESDAEENDDPLHRDTSAASVRSAPVVLQRPSSRGGAAFDISFEGEQSTPGLPRRLKRLEELNSSGRKKRDELTLEELQAKLQAAEMRRKEYENRLKEKMQQETKKAETYKGSLNTSLNESVEKTQTDVEEKEKAAVENREAHLKQLRERLKAKEERAKQVREKKRMLQQQSPSAPQITA